MNVALIGTSPSTYKGLRGRLMLVVALSVVLVSMLPGPVHAGWLTDTWPGSSAAPGSEADRVLQIARQQVGKPYKFATAGPDTFDCSGLIWYAFKTAGLADRMGGKRRGATAYLNWFKANLPNQVSSNLADARPGDILIWGGGQHAGIYISGNWAVSALNTRYDIRIHRADPMGVPFTAVLRVNMSQTSSGPPPSGSPDPTPTPDPNATPTPTPAATPDPPMPPTAIDATVQPGLNVSVSWSGATGSATPFTYRLYRNGNYYRTTKNLTYLDALWLPGHYDYAVQTVDATGARSFRSVSVSVTSYPEGTPPDVDDTTPPSQPTGLTAQSLGNKQVALTWQPSTDSGPSPVAYIVMRGGKMIARTSTPSYVDTPAKVGTYNYSVMAYDGYGNHATSSSVSGVSSW